MDQAAPSDQAVLWDLGKRGQDPDTDSCVGLCARGDRQKAAPPGRVTHGLMQVLSVTIFEKIQIQTALSSEISTCDTVTENNQLGSPSRQKIGIGCGTMPVNRSPIGAVWTSSG